jgi:hypothetical protein
VCQDHLTKKEKRRKQKEKQQRRKEEAERKQKAKASKVSPLFATTTNPVMSRVCRAVCVVLC